MVGVDDQEVDGADVAAGATEGRRARTAPPTTSAGSRRRRCWPAAGRRAAGADRRHRAGSRHGPTKVSVAQGDETIDIRDTGGSDQVFHAEGSHLAGRRPLPLDRGRPTPGSVPGASDPCRRAGDARDPAAKGMRPTGIAFGSPMPMIRHRFGGHLRAARARSCVAVRHAPPLAPPTPWEGTVDRGRSAARVGRRYASPVGSGTRWSDRRSLRDRRTIPSRRSVHEAHQGRGARRVPPVRLRGVQRRRWRWRQTRATIEIWSSLPRQGSNKAQTDTVVNAIKMALEERGGKVGGYTISLRTRTTRPRPAGKWDEATEIKNANDAVANDRRRGLHRHRSTRARPSCRSRSCASKGMVMISPANTYPGLTKAGKGEPNEPDVYYPNGCNAELRARRAGRRPPGAAGAPGPSSSAHQGVYVLDDTELYGKGIADVFRRRSAGLGVEVARPRGHRRQGDRLPGPGREDQGDQPRTSSTTAASPRTTPASCGATCATRWARTSS